MLTKDGRELSPSARLKSHLKKWKTDVGSDGSHRGFFAVTDLLRKNVGVCVLCLHPSLFSIVTKVHVKSLAVGYQAVISAP